MKFFGTAIIVCVALAAVVVSARAAHAQVYYGQWGADPAPTYYPVSGAHQCTYSIGTDCRGYRAATSAPRATVRRKVRR